MLKRLRHVVRVFARSSSWRFAKDVAQARALARSGVRGLPLARLRWHDRDIVYRPATSDPLAIYQVLLRRGGKAEYYLPERLRPEVILDIGSNIGTSILFFREKFPDAKIFGFEPHAETFRILEKNVAGLPGIEVFNYALGANNADVFVPFDGADFSRFTLAKNPKGEWSGPLSPTACQVRHAGEVVESLGLMSVDLVKIDCEGAEYDVMRSLPLDMVRGCKWIVGELHDETAFPLLALLAPHFDLDLKKTMFAPFFRFHACNLACVSELRGTFSRNALQR